jgi:hypothetical protein
MKKTITLLLIILTTSVSFSQVAPDKYHVRFTDKNNSPYSINNPQAFLSQRAIDRRADQNIPIIENDLPVNPDYIDSIASTGVTILNVSKWMNSVTIYTTDQAALDAIDAFPFVQSVGKNSSSKSLSKNENSSKPFFENESYGEFRGLEGQSSNKGIQGVYDYGTALNQIQMLNGDSLHDMGYDGGGMIIAVLDAGFLNVNSLSVFDSLWTNGQILGTRDFVNPQSPNIYGSHYHGCMVLSTMGANLPGEMVGTAPKADYWLIRTEDAATEYLIEELNWVSGAELADSLGADVINSSLGYTTFDDPNHNHTYADMDGNTAPITIGADIAASKGILVTNSAGNSGNDSWHYIGAPADGDSVFSIGSVNGSGVYTYFSSTGPTYDGRIKPNVVAKGQGTTIVNPWNGSIYTGNGTSFSSPVTAGMVACLWQANPGKTNIEIMEAVQQSASQANNPDSLLGYGIPNYMQANRLLAPVIHSISLDVKVILEGAYNGTDMDTKLYSQIPLNQPYNNPPFNYPGGESVVSLPNSDIVDWVLVELRDASSPASATTAKIVERKAAFLKTDASIVDLDGTSNLQFSLPISDSLYVVVLHRNHLGIISSFALKESGGIYSYDFTTDAGQAFGVNAQKDLGSGVSGMYSGDANADGSIDDLDKSGSWSLETGFKGYLPSDLNMDGESNNVDKNEFWQVNEGNSSQVPE